MNPQAYWGKFLRAFTSQTLLTELRWQVHNGKNTDFWSDPWIPYLPNFKISCPKPPMSKWVADVINIENGSWNTQKLAAEVSNEVLEAIQSLSLPLVNKDDQLIWHHNSNGIYSVKSGYHATAQILSSNQPEKPESSFKSPGKMWKVLWKMRAPNKIRSFWWRVCRNSLASRENLFRRRCASSNICPVCESKPETIEHLLFDCEWAKTIWFSFNIRVFGDLGGNTSAIKWTADMVDKMPGGGSHVHGKIVTIAWNVWKRRNEVVFRKTRVNPLAIVAVINHTVVEFSNTFEIPRVHR